jgi:putative membrane protein
MSFQRKLESREWNARDSSFRWNDRKKIMYLIVKSLHLISVISWMAGMLYLPRLFVYHANATPGSELSETLKVMERKLLRYIINPAMLMTVAFGVWMILLNPDLLKMGWLHAKFLFVLGMFAMHGILSKHRRRFAADANVKSAKYFRILNEIPTALMIVIVVLAVAKPF